VVDHRHAEPLFRPVQGVGIAALAREEQRAEVAEVVRGMWRPWGSSFLIARKAVGAVKRTLTRVGR